MEIKHGRFQTEYNIRFIMYVILHQYSRKEKERDLSSNMPCFLIDKTIIFLYDDDVRDTVQPERTVENSSEYRSREQIKKSRERKREADESTLALCGFHDKVDQIILPPFALSNYEIRFEF